MSTSRAEPQAPPLDERLCLALYTASHAMTATYRVLLSELGLTYPQYLVMVLLWESGAATVGEIGARLHLESSTLSPVVKRLELAGLVERSRDSRDERVVWVGLTRAGKAMKAKAKDVPSNVCDAAGISSAQQARLVKQLRAVAEHLEQSSRPVAYD